MYKNDLFLHVIPANFRIFSNASQQNDSSVRKRNNRYARRIDGLLRRNKNPYLSNVGVVKRIGKRVASNGHQCEQYFRVRTTDGIFSNNFSNGRRVGKTTVVVGQRGFRADECRYRSTAMKKDADSSLEIFRSIRPCDSPNP